ncbi:DUF6030 family protein [Pseudomonas sp. RIT412]|uniref:DUF6030 family protein n=1 Tax=Pseudomonas sp. RIT412 TaxID=2202161 RepID=UPI0021147560|nr:MULTISPECIES: DUF6030 family protein [unclassified Pseudomonas]
MLHHYHASPPLSIIMPAGSPPDSAKGPAMKRTIALLALAICSLPAIAEVAQPSPEVVCQYLADSGLKGRRWVADYGDGTSGCASDYKDIGKGSPLANNLAYYVTGEGRQVHQVKLVVNYNQPKSGSAATSALIAASQKLALKALGAKLPESVSSLIKAGRPGLQKLGSGEVEVSRDDWPTGKGYEIHVTMR